MPRGGAREGAGRKAGWAERGEKGGRPRGIKKPYKSFTVSCSPEEYETIKTLAEKENKTISRFLVDLVKPVLME